MCRLARMLSRDLSRDGRGRDEGKIEGDGTRWRVCPGLHVGWYGTRVSAPRAARLGKELEESSLTRASLDRLCLSAFRVTR